MGGEWRCTGAGTPGTWLQIRPAAVTADPASGTIPTGYLIWDVSDGAVKRHAGSYSWEITVGASTSAKVGLHGATPTAQWANANQAAATAQEGFLVLSQAHILAGLRPRIQLLRQLDQFLDHLLRGAGAVDWP